MENFGTLANTGRNGARKSNLAIAARRMIHSAACLGGEDNARTRATIDALSHAGRLSRLHARWLDLKTISRHALASGFPEKPWASAQRLIPRFGSDTARERITKRLAGTR
jgi:hypothetical protein